jgi:hypothetical protein
MSKLTEAEWLKLVNTASKIYNEQRLHRDFQADEIRKFVEWLYKQYGYDIDA